MTCSDLTECEGVGWQTTWTSGSFTSYAVPLGTMVLLGFVKEDTGEMVHAWFFETPGSWRLGHPYTLQHQTDAITATRATDGTMYEGELVTDLSNYNGGCECQINDGTPGPWGRICLRSKTPPSGGWTCTGAGGAVPIEIDFPYIRGWAAGTGCGTSSLSYYNWNSGPNFCSSGYKVIIMTNSAVLS
ncbi:unnamed protein product [Symbiodinium natans]|uniref:Uncharacterized protein n=1 Tax=Symbiodinium natans TaxID=878477 RepID=A0A812JL85_9DINO|nr:unnamed protein product [Symbiodinium natans]